MKVGKHPKMCGAMYQYYKTTKSNILTQTSSDTLSDALSEAMKKLSIKAKKSLKKKMERPRAALYSVEISMHWEKERDEDEYSVIGIEANYEAFNDKEVNNNEIEADLEMNNNKEYDSFKILRSKSMNTKTKACDEESYEEFLEGINQYCEAYFPIQCSSPFPSEDINPLQDQPQAPAASIPTSLDSALQAFSQSTATDRRKLKSKMPDPEHMSVHVRDKFSLERRSMITMPIMTVDQIKPRPKTAPDNSELDREWRKMMLKQRKTRRQMSV